MSSLIGKTLQGGKYRLEAVLGRGGFGLTFRAHQTYLDQVVVIKTLNESFWRSPNLSDLQQQFQDEARRLALCSHPNVVRVSDFFVEDGLPYMVMDYIPGRSLADIVFPENPLPQATAVSYVQQIGRALQAVHSKGLLHRDVKPQNIMLHQLTGEAVLIDFGIARELSQNPTQTHTSIVSEGYAPIEQYLPKAHRSAATDVYGLAATLYSLLTAQIPVAAVLRNRELLTPVQQLRPDVREGVAQAIAQGMAVELKDRPQSVGRWLTLLESRQRTGFFSRTQPPASKMPPPSPSEFPTHVVSPAYQSAPAATENGTVALPVPTGYGADTVHQPSVRPPVRTKNKGGGCAATLGIGLIAIAGIVAGAGFWLYQQLSDGAGNLPQVSLPEVELPAPNDAEGEQNEPVAVEEPEPEEPDSADSADDEGNAASDGEADSDEGAKPEKPPKSNSSEPPLLLTNSGNPANAQPGNTGSGIVAIPGFPPGASEDDIRARLGSPTRESSQDGFYTSVYTVVPNRVTLAYVYNEDSTRVRQSEAAFSPATDRLVMLAAFLGMLDGRSTKKIEDGLEAVRKGERDRFTFKNSGFSGTVERNANGYVHIYV
ncbi:MAG: serine/threonine protein kinase, partial [Phormidesmis sp.]